MDRPGMHVVGAGLVIAAVVCASACRRDGRDDAQRAEALRDQQLRALPYAQWVRAESGDGAILRGVVRHDAERAAPGLNLFCPRSLAQAFLVDMNGDKVHTWKVKNSPPWQHVELISNDDLLVVAKERFLGRIDWSSKVLWAVRVRAHHEATEAPDGHIYAATRGEEIVTLHGLEVPVLVDYISVYSADGEALQRLSLLDYFADALSERRVRMVHEWADANGIRSRLAARERADEIVIAPDTPGDLFHLNSIEVLPRTIPGVGRPGDLLVSVRQLNTIAVLEPNSGRVVWSWGPGELERQHHPTLLDNGNILVFDNRPADDFSRVLEMDPRSGDIVWQFRGTEEEPFHSVSRGANQRLANGNTLITESNTGRAFEVSPDGEIVWEYLCPVLRSEDAETSRAAIYRMARIEKPVGPR